MKRSLRKMPEYFLSNQPTKELEFNLKLVKNRLEKAKDLPFLKINNINNGDAATLFDRADPELIKKALTLNDKLAVGWFGLVARNQEPEFAEAWIQQLVEGELHHNWGFLGTFSKAIIWQARSLIEAGHPGVSKHSLSYLYPKNSEQIASTSEDSRCYVQLNETFKAILPDNYSTTLFERQNIFANMMFPLVITDNTTGRRKIVYVHDYCKNIFFWIMRAGTLRLLEKCASQTTNVYIAKIPTKLEFPSLIGEELSKKIARDIYIN